MGKWRIAQLATRSKGNDENSYERSYNYRITEKQTWQITHNNQSKITSDNHIDNAGSSP